MPAAAGINLFCSAESAAWRWIPAFAGMTTANLVGWEDEFQQVLGE